ncbi:MAG: 2-(1,2-epoxy-1,2-dihydrophenyl)acetyl-CoA isomerase, partial [Bacteroidetes bacterium]|nr:2-(1,2-epoxy-1,2-dihydrophenyl)acetyl-CoA isomerase [Bacteroidota bacterium]
MSTVLLHKENGVGYITFNRPEKYNSFNGEMLLTLQKHLEDCGNDDAV